MYKLYNVKRWGAPGPHLPPGAMEVPFMPAIRAKPGEVELLAAKPHIARVCAHVRGMERLKPALAAHGAS